MHGLLCMGILTIVNNIFGTCFLMVVCLLGAIPDASARDIRAEIQTLHVEQARLLKVRQHLELKLGHLGREMRELDQALLNARQALDVVHQQWLQSKRDIDDLVAKRKGLKQLMDILQQRMQKEANIAWQRANRQPSWLDIFAGVPVTEVPHRQYMMRYMLEKQGEVRVRWQEAWRDLSQVEQALRVEHEKISRLKEKKVALAQAVKARWTAKNIKMRALKHDIGLQAKRNHALHQEEKALLQLLEDLKDQLLASDQEAKQRSIRARKGSLPWPLKGRITVNFGEHLSHQKNSSLGVQIKPSGDQPEDRVVHAMHAGQVRYADWFGGFGLMMVVEYGHGIMAIYAHNDALQKQVGDWVDAGDVIAQAGSTGWVETTRLYFELRDKGKAVDPKRWCRGSSRH